MAADVAVPCASKWLHCFGIWQNRLFVCFNNGDCAHYIMDDPTTNLHYINLVAAASRGHYVNKWLGRGADRQAGPDIPYEKIGCPCADIEAKMARLYIPSQAELLTVTDGFGLGGIIAVVPLGANSVQITTNPQTLGGGLFGLAPQVTESIDLSSYGGIEIQINAQAAIGPYLYVPYVLFNGGQQANGPTSLIDLETPPPAFFALPIYFATNGVTDPNLIEAFGVMQLQTFNGGPNLLGMGDRT
jgi:hypothetical protein